MATTKTLTPTNQTISIPELTDAPDMSVPADAIDKEADAINALFERLDPITGTNKAWIANAELNNYKTTGVYYISTGSTIGGSSSGMSWFILTVIAGRSDTIVQTVYDSNTNVSEKTRQYRSNTWSDWYSASEHLANTCYADHSSGTSYTIPLTGYTSGNYWVALMYAQTGAYSYGLYLIFLNTSDAVFVNTLVTNGGRTFTGQRSGNSIVLTANDTVWGGIRVLMMN